MKTNINRLAGIGMAMLLAGQAALRAEERDFSKDRARLSPPWLRESVIYEIFPRNFSAGGDFNGITARLDELKDLGVNVLWLMPIHPVGQKLRKGTLGSPYAVRDYCAINPEYGATNDLKRLVKEAHVRGQRVVLVFPANDEPGVHSGTLHRLRKKRLDPLFANRGPGIRTRERLLTHVRG